MPVTAKLSRKFYEKLGDEIANELVNWFNQVDATYRADLRELNELNFQRFDAKMEQRLGQLEAKLEYGLAALRTELEAEFTTGLARHKAELTRVMFRFWIATLVPLAGLILAFHSGLP